MTVGSAIVSGEVVHVRLRPRVHRLRYRVFSLLIDVDDIDRHDRELRLFTRNRPGLVSLYDRDHGSGDGEPVGDHARRLLGSAGLGDATARVFLLAYPRVLGWVFNPLSVYYGMDRSGRLVGVIYEVNNRVGERHSYVIAAGEPEGGVYAHGAEKRMYVSPFTPAAGRYGFRLRVPGDEVLVAVQLHDTEGALLRTHFRGLCQPLEDGALMRAVLGHPLLAAKVVGGIHVEALRLLLKRVPIIRRHASPPHSVTVVDAGPAPSQG